MFLGRGSPEAQGPNQVPTSSAFWGQTVYDTCRTRTDHHPAQHKMHSKITPLEDQTETKRPLLEDKHAMLRNLHHLHKSALEPFQADMLPAQGGGIEEGKKQRDISNPKP